MSKTWLLPVIIGVLLFGVPNAFGTIYTNVGSGDWNTPTIWEYPNPDPEGPTPLNGVPGPGDTKFINHVVTISTPITNSFTGFIFVDTPGTLIVDSTLTNHGFFDLIEGNRGIINFGTTTFTENSVFHNNGLYENFGGQTNINVGAQFNHNCAANNGHFHNENGNVLVSGIFNSTGDIHQLSDGIMNVTGTLDNSTGCGIIDNRPGSIIDNKGNSIHNHGLINITFTSKLINHANALLNNHIAGEISIDGGTLENKEDGLIENSGTIDNNALGTIDNEGKMVNDGAITSESLIKNLYKGLIEQKNIFTNENGGTLNNFGELNVTSIMTNNAGGTIDNKFDEPNVEFGNIYLNMNITNNGVVNDCGIIDPPHKVHPTKAVLCDLDEDFLLDSWETHGIDFNHDKTIDLTLTGADKNHKDLYLEIDYMTSHNPSVAEVNAVVNAFAAAPKALVNNPDGTDGINLHVEIDESVPHQDELSMWAGFDAIKKDKFGTAAQRADEAKIDAKKFSYRYGLFIHKMEGTGSSGRGELPGNDFVVSLGGFSTTNGVGHNVGSSAQKSATLMHELGHTLDLHHGGQDDFNCKPNYFSIMSYTFQFDGLVPGRPLDYSRQASATMNEASLNEMTGVPGPAGRSTIVGTEFQLPNNRTTTGTSFNFDRDGTQNEVAVTGNVNWLGDWCPGAGSVLIGYSDWDNIEYDFRTQRDFISDGAPHPEEGENEEMDQAQLDAFIASINPKACIIPEEDDWTLIEDCTLTYNATTPENVIVQNEAVLTVPNGLTLNIDFENYALHVNSGGGVLVKLGGTIT